MTRHLLCYITDRKQLKSAPVAVVIKNALRAGVDLVQIREKDLPSRELMELVEEALGFKAGAGKATPGSAGVKPGLAARELGTGGSCVVVNDRVDVALAAGADGVHLGSESMPVQVLRRLAPHPFLVGVSCHSLEEAMAAESGGADYLVLGPIFETPSKLGYGPPLGLEKLRLATSRSRIPVLALGGISVERIRPCLEAGAAGIAGIRVFQDSESVVERVSEMRAQFPGRQ
jgi:thiamine-phosphate pyrophosphorylase